MLRIAPRTHVHIHIVANHRRRHHRVRLMLLLQCFELIEDLLRRNDLLVDPALLALLRLHTYKAPAMLQHLQPLAVVNGRGPVRHRRDPVAQVRLLRRHVHILRCRLWTQPRAAAHPDQQTCQHSREPHTIQTPVDSPGR